MICLTRWTCRMAKLWTGSHYQEQGTRFFGNVAWYYTDDDTNIKQMPLWDECALQ